MTYSLAVIGRDANHRFPPAAITNVSTTVALLDLTLTDANAIAPGAQQRAAMLGTQVLCQLSDGSQAYFVLDAERSLPGSPVMRRV